MKQTTATAIAVIFGLVLSAGPASAQDSRSDKFDGLEKEFLQGSDDNLPAWDPLPERDTPREPIDPIRPGDPEMRRTILEDIDALKSLARPRSSQGDWQ